jgi:hypothetical protein
MTTLLALVIAAAATAGPPVPSAEPPPAHVSAGGVTKRMAMGSYCWTSGGQGTCVDVAALPGGPRVPIAPGRRVTFRFAFVPEQVTLYTGRRTVRLAPRRVTHWRATEDLERLSLFVRVEGGDVSYAARAARR